MNYQLIKNLFLSDTKDYLELVRSFYKDTQEVEGFTSIIELEALERLEDDLQDVMYWFS